MFHNVVGVLGEIVVKHSTTPAIEYTVGSGVTTPSLTYQQLHDQSGYLADLLTKELSSIHESNTSQVDGAQMQDGYLNQSVIGVLGRHSHQLIISLLAVFKSLNIYLPLDETLPLDRLHYMVDDSNCKILLINHSHHNHNQDNSYSQLINNNKKVKTLCIDCLINNNNNSDIKCNNNQNNIKQDTKAYLIYTSGSTGLPKGVLVSHRGVYNFVKDQIKAFKFVNGHRLLLSLPICFDASMSEIFTSLLSGSTIVIHKSKNEAIETRSSSHSFVNCLKQNRISNVMLAPSYLVQLEPSFFTGILNTIVIGGETCPVHVIKKWIPYVRLVSVYGPTEATVCTSIMVYSKEKIKEFEVSQMNKTDQEKEEEESVLFRSIGETIENLKVYIVGNGNNSQLEILNNVGDEGEIYIGGVGVADGYFNRPELSSKSFIENESLFGVGSGVVFKTGDWARILKQNQIQFKGRIDNQVKLQGQRIELDEIKIVLESHPWINQACLIIKIIDGSQYLIAYFTPTDKLPNGRELKEYMEVFSTHLSIKLPSYMIPNHYIKLSEFPQNGNEKVDKDRLPIPHLNGYQIKLNSCIKLEDKLKCIMDYVMMSDIRLDVDLYTLGLNSISSIRFLVLCRDNLSVYIRPSILVSNRTLSAIANAFEKEEKEKRWIGLTLRDEPIPHGRSQLQINYSKSIKELKQIGDQILLENRYKIENCQGKRNENPPTKCTRKGILITGATGSIGSTLLNSFWNDSDLKMKYNTAGLSRNPNTPTVLVGNVNHTFLGLSEEKDLFQYDTIIHSAANVNLSLPLEDLIHDNVLSLFMVIQTMLVFRNIKELHYISTLAVMASSSDAKTDQFQVTGITNKEYEESTFIYGGYAQSKWICEYLLKVLKLEEMRIKLTIHRPAMIMNPQKSNYLDLLVETCKQVGHYPDFEQTYATDFTPIHLFNKMFIKNFLDRSIPIEEYHSYIQEKCNSQISEDITILDYRFHHDLSPKVYNYTYKQIDMSTFLSTVFKEYQQKNITQIPMDNWKKLLLNPMNNQCNPNTCQFPFMPFVQYLDDHKLIERIIFPGSLVDEITKAEEERYNIDDEQVQKLVSSHYRQIL